MWPVHAPVYKGRMPGCSVFIVHTSPSFWKYTKLVETPGTFAHCEILCTLFSDHPSQLPNIGQENAENSTGAKPKRVGKPKFKRLKWPDNFDQRLPLMIWPSGTAKIPSKNDIKWISIKWTIWISMGIARIRLVCQDLDTFRKFWLKSSISRYLSQDPRCERRL